MVTVYTLSRFLTDSSVDSFEFELLLSELVFSESLELSELLEVSEEAVEVLFLSASRTFWVRSFEPS